MNRLPENDGGLIVPFTDLVFTDGFEACWAGELSLRSPLIPQLLCFGSIDGRLLFTDWEAKALGESQGSVSGEAINGVAWAGTWAAVSTRQEVNFWSFSERQGGYLPQGAHGIAATSSGYFIAPLGQTGILTVKPPLGDHSPLMAHSPGDENFYVYRVISLRSQTGEEVIVCAARMGGIMAGHFSGSRETHTMNTVGFKNIDIVDICPLSPGLDSLAVAALGRDGSLILFQDVLTDKNPRSWKPQSGTGVAYRVLSCRGDIYVLTSKGLYVFAKLGSRFVSGELLEGMTPPAMRLPMAGVDMNVAWGQWLLVVLANAVRRFDVKLIQDYVHQHIGQGEIQELQTVAVTFEPEWRDLKPTARLLEIAGEKSSLSEL